MVYTDTDSCLLFAFYRYQVSSMHTFGEHMDNLQSLCRFCGSKIGAKSAKPKDCSAYRDSIWTVLAINVQDDVPGQHPSKMCQRCYRTMLSYWKKKIILMMTDMPAKRAREISWEPYNSECYQCSTCRMSQKKGIGGRKKKPDFSHNETFLLYNLSQDNIFSSLYDNSTISFLPKMNKQEKCHFSLRSMPSSFKEKFEYRLFSSFFTHHVVKTKCNHYFCAVCLSAILKMSISNSVPCPTCDITNKT
uniref:NRAG1 protein n=1 Tax=Aplysia californica TaxID=6500 RepID=A8BFK9_APLCA|nr:NRAG1 protein [Aplysia californica]